MNTKGVLKRVVIWGMLFAGGMGYAQSNHWKEHTQTTEVTVHTVNSKLFGVGG